MASTEVAPQSIGAGLEIAGESENRELKGDERAAVLMLALGPDFGKPIFEELDDIEIRQLSRAMSNMGAVTQDMLDILFAKFVTNLTTNGDLAGGVDSTERLLLSFMSQDRVDMIMEEIRGPAGRNIWEKLSNVQEDVLASFLKNEYPQTISVVLTKLATDHASRVLGSLPEELAMDVVQRMLAIEPVQKEIVEKIEDTLRNEFMSTLSHTRRRDSHEQMADIFNAFDRQTEARFLTNLEERDIDSAERIKALMFTFDDLGALDGTAIQTVLQAVEKPMLTLGLKGANEQTRDLFLKNMSARAAKMLKDDMEAMGPVRLKDVDEAQSAMVNLAKDLAAKGEIVITKNGSDEEMIG
ncbi:flagellar motor switch protein FliG [Maritalea sp.]|uniref:flagellar motor switch protein FliG n=1 Tax=Maritalea sp. TaxID=2003361 RepID=UPI003EF5A3C5